MNTPELETERLILRKFTEKDIEALFLILKDEEVNTFLPWYPLKNLEETKKFYEERYASQYAQPQAYAYAVCLKEDNFPIGYINVDMEEHHDLGYGLRKEFWHKGIVTEAGKAVVEQVKKDGLPYITATHDVNNPRSGGVMQQIGMKYQYSYEERVQPKDMLVIFRMYQLNFDGNTDFVYKKYWNESDNHFIEQLHTYITLRQRPELKEQAAAWFHNKWEIPQEAYVECMEAYLNNETEYGWYLCLDGDCIVGGLGVIENDFHNRKDLAPNVCAVYTEEGYRCQGIAGKLLDIVVKDLKSKGITPIYLITDHTNFYERYGWEFLCMVQGDNEPEMTRMYIHR